MITDKPARLTDLSQFKIIINGNDVTGAIAECHIWQDIFTPTWSAAITLSDTNNMIHTIPIGQGTPVQISLATKNNMDTDGEKTFNFIVYKITDRQLEKSKHQSYTIQLVHQHIIKNSQERVKKYYKQNISQVVSEVISEKIGGSVDADSSENEINLIIPNWSPFVVAHWCARAAVVNGAADCVFFMYDEGQYKFKSLENMYNDDCGVTLIQQIADIRDESANIPDDACYAYSQFAFEHGDALANMVAGMYGNEVHSYDFVKKVWDEQKFNYGEDGVDGSQKSFLGSVFSDMTKSNINFVPKHDKLYEDGEHVYDNSDKWSGSRRSNVMKLNQDRLFVQIPGGAIAWQWLGRSINVKLPSHEDMTEEKEDKYYSGKYLVVAVAHQIKVEEYHVTLELIKKRTEQSMG